MRFALGGSELFQYDKDGGIRRDYVDIYGDASTKTAYDNQYYSRINQGIVSYSNRDRQLFIRSTMDF